MARQTDRPALDELSAFVKDDPYPAGTPFLAEVLVIGRLIAEDYVEKGPLQERHFVCRQCQARFVQRWDEWCLKFANLLLDHTDTHRA